MINLGLVLAGAVVVIAIGYVLGLLTPLAVTAETNSQVASRVNPKLIDLLAALATGTVGAYAVVRSDVSDSLPGVAIAISLVPPLAVVGLTLESGAGSQALGALLLFGTNVAAIIVTGICVLLVVRFREAARSSGGEVGHLTGRSLTVVIAALVLVAVPLTLGSVHVVDQQRTISKAQPVAEEWAVSQAGRSPTSSCVPGCCTSSPWVVSPRPTRRSCARHSTMPGSPTLTWTSAWCSAGPGTCRPPACHSNAMRRFSIRSGDVGRLVWSWAVGAVSLVIADIVLPNLSATRSGSGSGWH